MLTNLELKLCLLNEGRESITGASQMAIKLASEDPDTAQAVVRLWKQGALDAKDSRRMLSLVYVANEIFVALQKQKASLDGVKASSLKEGLMTSVAEVLPLIVPKMGLEN